MKTDPTFWLLARASGLTAYALLTASVLAGLVLKSRPFRSLKPAAVTDTHRFLALLGLGAIGLHGVTLLLDRTVHLTPAALLVPGASPYRPLAGRDRRPGGGADARRLRVLRAPPAHRHEELAPAALGDLRDLRRGHRARPRGRDGHAQPWAFADLSRGGRLRAGAVAWRALAHHSPTPRRTTA